MTESERNVECLRQKVKRHTGVLGVLYPNKKDALRGIYNCHPNASETGILCAFLGP